MTKQVTLETTRAGGFGLPTGQVIPGGGSITVEPEIWAEAKDHPVVAAMVKDGSLIVDGKGKKKPEPADEDALARAVAEEKAAGDKRLEEATEAFDKRLMEASRAAADELKAAEAKIAEQQKTIGDRDAEIAKLKQGGK